MNRLTPFGELPIDERVAMFRAHQEGKKLQVYTSTARWVDFYKPTWAAESIYRIAPEPPSINWDHVAPEYVALAMDDDGEWYLGTMVPHKTESFWDAPDDAEWIDPKTFASFVPGTCPWDESRVLRPEAKEAEPENRFRNHYRCHNCLEHWIDESPHTNDDRCPECDMANSPYKSEDL